MPRAYLTSASCKTGYSCLEIYGLTWGFCKSAASSLFSAALSRIPTSYNCCRPKILPEVTPIRGLLSIRAIHSDNPERFQALIDVNDILIVLQILQICSQWIRLNVQASDYRAYKVPFDRYSTRIKEKLWCLMYYSALLSKYDSARTRDRDRHTRELP